MNRNVYMILLALISSGCNAKFSLREKIKNVLQGSTLERIDQKELPAESITSLSLTNINGSITIKTGPKKSLFLRTMKRGKKETIMDALEVVTETNNNHLAITTKNNNKKNIGSVEYELIVPASLDIALNIIGKGNVFIKDVHGTIDVVTKDNITIINSKKLASAQSIKKGSITIVNAYGPIEAYTQQGNIIGENITHSFDARSTTGKINITYKKLPATSSINLTTISGNIVLALPTEINAEICGHTARGTFMSDHEITLKSYATKLNKTAWTKFTKEVNGILGNGEATIMVHSTKGNVKIVETKIT